MKRFLSFTSGLPVLRVPLFLLALVLLANSGYSAARSQPSPESAELARQQNRLRLMAKVKKRTVTVPLTPEQKRRDIEQKRATRLKNREMLAMHSRWRPGTVDALWTRSLNEKAPVTREALQRAAKLRTVIRRLEGQLGKPYVWGGKTPTEGFDCSGLVFYAYNAVLERKLPRTANEMYQANHLKPVRRDKLRNGDLVFFNINQRPGADHVGVYLGDDKFIEAPRTGLKIRISQLSDNFWQSHYLGARRILSEDAAL
ncbi:MULTISPECIES: C40 family peptidase [Citrobacter]|uniref:C40 family peptidase n=1 Tax=Citrobacter TaxID=544 RepID=UPI000A4D9CE2|nr:MULTISPECIES: C40 family peptidase [Citrobacter]